MFIAIAQALPGYVHLSPVLECSKSVSSAHTCGGAEKNLVSTQFNPHTYVGHCGLANTEPGFNTDLPKLVPVQMRSIRVKPGFTRRC